LAGRIDEARKVDESNVVIQVNMLDSAKYRWCVWLYGQPLWKYGDDSNHAVLDIGGIYRFSVEEGDHGCANACLDAIREILVDQHHKIIIHLSTLLDFLVQTQEASQMLIDLLVYGPYATSGLTRDWLREMKVEPEFLSFFYRLSWAFATRVANEAAGDESKHPNIMELARYHISIIEESDSASDSAKALFWRQISAFA
jgi:hypothetical protein